MISGYAGLHDLARLWRDVCESASLGHMMRLRATATPYPLNLSAKEEASIMLQVRADVPDYFTGRRSDVVAVHYVRLDQAAEMTRDEVVRYVRDKVRELVMHEFDENFSADGLRWDPHQPARGPQRYSPPERERYRGQQLTGMVYDEMSYRDSDFFGGVQRSRDVELLAHVARGAYGDSIRDAVMETLKREAAEKDERRAEGEVLP